MIAALLPGCTDAPTDGDAELTPESMPAEARLERASIAFEKPYGVGSPVVSAEALAGGAFPVRGGAGMVIANASWTCASGPLCQLALVVFADTELVDYVEGASPLSLVIESPGRGEYDAILYAQRSAPSVVVQAQGTLDVVVRYPAETASPEEVTDDATTP